MKKYIFLLIAAAITFFVASELRIERERIPTEAEVVSDMLENFVFVRPREIEVLYKKETVDNKERQKILVLVLKSDEEYLPKSQRIVDNAENIILNFKTLLPDYDFGTAKEGNPSFFRMLTADSEWSVSTIKTTQGYFSQWKRVTDIFSATSLE